MSDYEVRPEEHEVPTGDREGSRITVEEIGKAGRKDRPDDAKGRDRDGEAGKDGKDGKAGKDDKDGKKKMNPILEWLIIIAIALAAALFINYVLIVNSVVPSGSMEPTIMTNSRMMGLRVTYWFGDPQQGDIIVFKYPDDPSQNFVKRVIGTPGDTVEIKGGVTYVNGEVLDEPYLNETPKARDFGPYEVPEDCYFVMGDNRNNSHDSRFWTNTYVPRSSVLGKALFCYWPLDRIGPLK